MAEPEVVEQSIRQQSRRALGDEELQENLARALQHTLTRRQAHILRDPSWHLRRERASQIRAEAIDRQPELVAELISRIEDRGGQVSHCADATEATATVLAILQAAGARLVVKGKSMVTEEIELNRALEQQGIEVWEGDLGELIVQLRQEPPAHITAPALHLNRRQIASLFARHLDHSATDVEPGHLTAAARRFLAHRFREADAGITGANFLVAESGSLVLVENESNIRLATTLPRLHIAICGAEKIVPRLADLAPLLGVLAPSATGQQASAAVSILGGVRRQGEVDGAEQFHLILVDNGRSRLRADPVLRSALGCIRCGACLNICPVYQRIGGHGYGSVYPGPIGVVFSRALLGKRDDAHAFACSLCGACDEICPVQVPLTRMILEIRRRCQLTGPAGERLVHRTLATVARQPRLFSGLGNLAAALLAIWPVNVDTSLTHGWTSVRAMPRRQRDPGVPGR